MGHFGSAGRKLMGGQGLSFALPAGVPHFGCKTVGYCAQRIAGRPDFNERANFGGAHNSGSLRTLMKLVSG